MRYFETYFKTGVDILIRFKNKRHPAKDALLYETYINS